MAGDDQPVRRGVPMVGVPPPPLPDSGGEVHAVAAEPHPYAERGEQVEPAVGEVEEFDQDDTHAVPVDEVGDCGLALGVRRRVARHGIECQSRGVAGVPVRWRGQRLARGWWVSDDGCAPRREFADIPAQERFADDPNLGEHDAQRSFHPKPLR